MNELNLSSEVLALLDEATAFVKAEREEAEEKRLAAEAEKQARDERNLAFFMKEVGKVIPEALLKYANLEGLFGIVGNGTVWLTIELPNWVPIGAKFNCREKYNSGTGEWELGLVNFEGFGVPEVELIQDDDGCFIVHVAKVFSDKWVNKFQGLNLALVHAQETSKKLVELQEEAEKKNRIVKQTLAEISLTPADTTNETDHTALALQMEKLALQHLEYSDWTWESKAPIEIQAAQTHALLAIGEKLDLIVGELGQMNIDREVERECPAHSNNNGVSEGQYRHLLDMLDDVIGDVPRELQGTGINTARLFLYDVGRREIDGTRRADDEMPF